MFVLGFITLLRVIVLIAIASLIWVPLGVLIGLRPALAEKIQPLAQFLAAFPANLLFPVFVVVIVTLPPEPGHLALAADRARHAVVYPLQRDRRARRAYPNDYREAATNFRIRGWQWWRQVMLPGIFPVLRDRRDHRLGRRMEREHRGRGRVSGATRTSPRTGSAPISRRRRRPATIPKIILGIAVMSLFVTLFNRLLWRPLYAYAEAKLRLD